MRVKKFCCDTYFASSRVGETGFATHVPLEEALRITLDYEFIRKEEGHTFRSE